MTPLYASIWFGIAIAAKGYLAVDLFFMLSGYVMARTYEPRMARGFSPAAFFLARYRRLWPGFGL